MLVLIRKTITFLREKHVFHKLGLLVSLTIIAIACYVLYRMLHNLDFGKLITALQAKSYQSIALAMLFVAAGYFTLTFYDLFALRTIGRTDVPYRIAALAGFTSYSIGHNVGASALTGGAVRYRVYSAWGLNAVDVAKVCFIAGLTFWLGNAAVLGLGISYHPEAAARDRPPAGLAQPGRGVHSACRSCGLRRLGLDARRAWSVAASGRDVAGRSADAAADRHRHHRSRLLRAGDVHAGARHAAHRFRDGRGDLRLGDAARIRQSLAGRTRRVRCGDAGRPVASSTRKSCWRACCCFACSTISRHSCSRF